MPSVQRNGYALISLGRKHKAVLLHRVIAEAFIGPIPPGKEVNHRDGNKRNNAAANLEIATKLENMTHAVHKGLLATGDRWRTPKRIEMLKRVSGDGHWSRKSPSKVARGEGHSQAKLTAADVAEIRTRKMTVKEYAQQYGVCVRTIYDILSNRKWRQGSSNERVS